MEILFVTSEVAPYSRRTHTADVAAALPKALRGLGHKVTVVSPLYASIDPSAHSLARRLSTVRVEVAGKSYTCTLYDGRTTGGVDLVFLGNTELFMGQEPGEEDSEHELLAAIVLSGAAAQLARIREPAVELLHAHGHAAALSLPWAQTLLPDLACVLSLHDPRSTAELPRDFASKLALPAPLLEVLGGVPPSSLLLAGVSAADGVVADSGESAQSLLDDPSSALASLLRGKGARFTGIVDGVDASIWNPLTDSRLAARFDPVNLEGKTRCKGVLQYQLGVTVDPDLPVIAALGELSLERGGDLIAEAAEHVLHGDAQLVVLGGGPPAERLQALATELPDRMALGSDHDDKLLHLALAGSDFLLLPAREPAGTDLALCALRYGTLPIARTVGALADTLVDVDAKLETGNAFVIESSRKDEVVAAAQRALGAYAKRSAFDALRRRAMRTDVSWERAARRYEQLYKQIKAGKTPRG